ncbi:MAG: RNA methyltransferase substrate-binding domain-containing protein, partial [Candidatus Neomarinimicrobiota bacterium]
MLSRAEKSRFRSLKQKKERDLSGLFLVEGIKPVKEALATDFPLERIIISEHVSQQEYRAIAEAADLQNIAIVEATQFEIEQICSL